MIINPSDDKFDIIIVAGQSNASGCGLGETKTPWQTCDNIMMFNKSYKADVVSTPYGDMIEVQDTGDCYLSLADERGEKDNKTAVFCLAFAKKYVENRLEKGRKVLLVQAAIGGTGFAKNHWGENQKLSNRMFEMVDAALSMNTENRIVAILWHQGEHDIFENARLDYEQRKTFYIEKLSKFITSVRAKYGNVPFISAGFCKTWLDLQQKERVGAIVDAYKFVISKTPLAGHVENTGDLKSNSQAVVGSEDTVHFCRDSSYELGRRYYEKYIDIIKGE